MYICVGTPAHWACDIKQCGGIEYCDRCMGQNRSVYGLCDHLIIFSHSCQMLPVEPFEGHGLFRKSHHRIEACAVNSQHC